VPNARESWSRGGCDRLTAVETDELTIVVVVAVGATPLERDGVLRRLEDVVGAAVQAHAPGGYITHATIDPGEVRLVIDAPALATPPVLSLVGDAINALMADPDLLGWGPFSVKVTDEASDEADADGADGGAEVVHRSPLDPRYPVDPELSRRRLLDDADHVLGGLDLQWLTVRDVDDADPDEREAALTEARYVAGALYHAAVTTVDHLFGDLAELTGTGDPGATVRSAKGAAFFVLEDLPARYAHRYDALFVQQLIVAAVTVTARLTEGWRPLACVAEELALRLLLDQAEVRLEAADLDLPGWRGIVEDCLFEDTDHELLFDPGLDGIEDDEESLARTGTTPLAFTRWFTPFNAGRPVPPYLLDSAGLDSSGAAQPAAE